MKAVDFPSLLGTAVLSAPVALVLLLLRDVSRRFHRGGTS